MWDYFHLADNALNVQVFNGLDIPANNKWQIWHKPRGAKMVLMLVIGSGGGGGAGFSGAAGTARGGGGGGGGGAISRFEIPAFVLPDLLYVSVSKGGAPGSPGTSSFVSSAPLSTIEYVYATAVGGGAGGGGTGSAGGSGASVSIPGPQGIHTLTGFIFTTIGPVGASAGAISGAAGASVAPLGSFITCGGAGGGSTPAANTNFDGGGMTAQGVFTAPIPGGTAGGGKGSDGFVIREPFCACGGAGGGTNGASGTGGAGGNGGIGCGGGGGGAGVTGGAGGSGGPGMIMIVSL